MANIRIASLCKYFGNVKAVKNLNLEVQEQCFMTLLGPSGCGKSTVLNILAGLETPSSGEIYLDNVLINQVPPAARDVAMVFQSYALYPHMNVRDNLVFALKIRKVPKAVIETKLDQVSNMLGIRELLGRKPRELSGGQRQRVAIGRAIVREPKVFLLDEPLSNLDAGLRLQMRAELKMLFDRLKATVIYVTHDQAEAMTMSDRIAVLKDGQLQQVGTPLEIYYRPVNKFVAGFVGSPAMNFSLCSLVANGLQLMLRTSDFGLCLSDEASAHLKPYVGKGLIMGVRPEDLDLNGGGANSVLGTCMVVERLGSNTILLMNTGTDTYTMEVPGAARVKPGENLSIQFDPNALYVFEEDNGRALLTATRVPDEGGIADEARQ